MSFLTVIFFTVISLSIGRLIREKVVKFFDSYLLNLVIDFGIGTGLFSVLMFFLNTVHLVVTSIKYLLILIFLLIGYRYIKAYFVETIENLKHLSKLKIKFNFETLLLLVLFVNLLIIFITEFTPPTSNDAIAYHLTVPKIYINNNGFVRTDFIVQSATPFNIEMQYQYVMWLSNSYAAKLLHFIYFLFILLLFYIISKKWFKDTKIAFLSILFFTLNPFSLYFSGTAYITFGVYFYVILSGILFIEWIYKNDDKYIILSAIFSGLAVGSKTTSLAVVIIYSIIIIIKKVINREHNFFKLLFKYNLIAFVLYSPWFIKNYLLFSNPVWPYMYNIFGGKYLDTEFVNRILNKVKMYGFHRPIDFLTLFYDITFYPRYGGALNNFGPLFVAFLPGILFISVKKNKYILFILLYIIIFSGAFFLLTQQYRFMVHIIFFVSILISIIILNIKFKSLKFIVWFFIIINFLFFSAYNFGGHYKRLKVIFEMLDKEIFLEKKIPEYTIYKFANNKLSRRTDKILLFTTNCFYLNIPFFWGASLEQNIIKYNNVSIDDIYKSMKENGITHIIYRNNTKVFNGFDKFKIKYLKKIFSSNGFILEKLL